ncbi:uncharacterized protein DS421_3g87920 [Arachis hypogaea]|nr:uncharacterized protein DS421_3g87920 [Arachis hypogaea]
MRRKRKLTRFIEEFGYKKLKWVVGEKIDSLGSARAQPGLRLWKVFQFCKFIITVRLYQIQARK